MPASAGIATPIRPYRVRGTIGAVAPTQRNGEENSQTFIQGVPVQVDTATGFMRECATINSAATAIIAGISQEAASNLTTSGVKKTLVTGQAVPNQPAAQIIPFGAPPNDGTVGFYAALQNLTFQGVLGNSSTGVAAVAQTDLGAIYGLTKDATTKGWYVDKFITTTAGGACVKIMDFIDPVGTANGRVEFTILAAAQQLSS